LGGDRNWGIKEYGAYKVGSKKKEEANLTMGGLNWGRVGRKAG